MAINNGSLPIVKQNSYKKPYISDEQLHMIEHPIYHGIMVQDVELKVERISERYECR